MLIYILVYWHIDVLMVRPAPDLALWHTGWGEPRLPPRQPSHYTSFPGQVQRHKGEGNKGTRHKGTRAQTCGAWQC